MELFKIGKIFLVFALLSGVFLQAEEAYEMEWVEQFGTSSNDYANSVAVDADGNLFIAGRKNGLYGLVGSDAFIAKYSSDGNLLWFKQYGTSTTDLPESITVDASGDLFVVGSMYEATDYELRKADAFITKYSSDGALIWIEQFGTANDDNAKSIAVDADGNLIVAGYTYGEFDGESTNGWYDAFIAKYSSDGALIWVRQFGAIEGFDYTIAPNDYAMSVTVGSSGDIFVTGDTMLVFDGESSSGGRDAFIAKYSSDGALTWIKQFGTSGHEFTESVTVDDDGNLIVAGYTDGEFDGESNSGLYDAFIAKYSSDGALTWIKQFGTAGYDYSRSVTSDADGNLFVTGSTSGEFAEESSSGGARDAFISKYSSDGTLIWVRQFGTAYTDYGKSVTSDAGGNLFVTGSTPGEFDGESSSGWSDAFIAKFKVDTNIAPIANAGDDKTVTIKPDDGRIIIGDLGTFIAVDGSASYDPDENNPLTYSWTLISKPAASSTTFKCSSDICRIPIDVEGTYELELIVTDSLGKASEPDTVVITAIYNTPPIADAGDDQSITIVGTAVDLNGSGSYDEDDGDYITSYLWEIVTKPENSSALIEDPYSVATTFTADVYGDYTIILYVRDVLGVYGQDEVVVSFNNVAPVADAGVNQSAVVGNTVLLDGSGSFDANGDSITYSWSLSTLPDESEATIDNPSNPITSFIPDVGGIYHANLIVNDGSIDSEPAIAEIVVVSVSTATTQIVSEIIETINDLPAESLSNPNLGNALTNKLNAVLDMISKEQYEQALGKLQTDILPKTDGCAFNEVPDKQDWIQTCEEQEVVYNYILETIARLETLIAE